MNRKILGVSAILLVSVAGALSVGILIHRQAETATLQYYGGGIGYLEFLNFANATGDIILTEGQSIPLPTNVTFVIIFTPYPAHANAEFMRWIFEGDAVLSNETAYITDLTLFGDTVLTAISSAPTPVPEFPQAAIAIVALVVPLFLLRRRRGT